MIDPLSIILGIAGGVISNAIYAGIEAYRMKRAFQRKGPDGPQLLGNSISIATRSFLAPHHGAYCQGSLGMTTLIKPAFDLDIDV